MKLFRKSVTIFSMNNKKSLAYLILIIAPLFSACRGPVEKEKQNDASASFVPSTLIGNEKYVIDKKESVVTWKCSMAFADKGGHHGYVFISKGELMIEKGQLEGGTVEVDMNTITDESHRNDNNLIEHLKSPDFFEVEKFPISTFAITRVESVNDGNAKVTGVLIIKGISQTITFPAKIEVKEGIVNANGKVVIDRTQWDVRYKSGKFFANLANEAISDSIEFDMKIVAKK
jgi:polyisoprenoid-binding protein YceI